MKKILSLALTLLVPIFAFAIEDIKKVHLKDAISIAVENNIELKSKNLDIEIAKNNIEIANRLHNPSLHANYLYGAAGNTEPKLIGFSQTLEINKRKAKKELEQAKYNLSQKKTEYTKFDLIMDVREAYIELVSAKSILDSLEQQRIFQKQLLDVAKNKRKTQSTDFIDAIQTEITLNHLVTQVNTAKADVDLAKNKLNKIINASNGIVYDSEDDILAEANNFEEMNTPRPDFNFPDINDFIEIALKNRQDLEIALQEIEVARAEMYLSTKSKIPDLTLGAGYAHQTKNYSETGATLGGGFVGVSVDNIPLFYSHTPEIQNKAYKLEQAQLKYLSLKDKAKKDVASAYQKFLTSAKNLNQYEDNILQNSEKLIKTSVKLYEEGKIDISDLIISKQTYKTTIIGYTYALADYYNSWTDFLREINDVDFEFKIKNL